LAEAEEPEEILFKVTMAAQAEELGMTLQLLLLVPVQLVRVIVADTVQDMQTLTLM
jgi:hypothetical protein